MSGKLSRRRVLGTGAAAGAAALTGLSSASAARAQQALDWQPKLLSTDQAVLLSRLCDLLLPRTSTPGALDAGVPEFIDLQLSTQDGDEQLAFTGGLSWIERRSQTRHSSSFLELDDARQSALLREISDEHASFPPELKAGAAFFAELKSRSLFAFFTSKVGRTEVLGRPGEVRREKLVGCEHSGDHSA